DGRGIDVAAVRRAARRILGEREGDALSDADALSLIMLPRLSTSPKVTAISGRGLRLDVVRGKIETLQRRNPIEKSTGNGTTFRLVIPVSLSTIRCMLARIGTEIYAIPTTSIEHIVSLGSIPNEARFSAGGRPMMRINERAIGVAALAEVLERPVAEEPRYA